MSAFDDIVRWAGRCGAEIAAVKSGTPVVTLLHLVKDHGPISTADLALRSGLKSNLVWGVLKYPRDRGQVVFSGGAWIWNSTYIRPELTKARALLEDAGWKVTPPC